MTLLLDHDSELGFDFRTCPTPHSNDLCIPEAIMLAKVCNCMIDGLNGALIEVDVEVGNGQPALRTLALPTVATVHMNPHRERGRLERLIGLMKEAKGTI